MKPIMLLTSLLVVAGLPAPALAHAFPVKADPKVGATLANPPAQVRIWFDEPLQAGMCHVELEAGNHPMPHCSCGVDPKDATLVHLQVPKLAKGKYEVRWHVVSVDGHPTQGTYGFKVQ